MDQAAEGQRNMSSSACGARVTANTLRELSYVLLSDMESGGLGDMIQMLRIVVMIPSVVIV